MQRLDEVQRIEARVFAPSWASRWRLGAAGVGLVGLLVGLLAAGGVLPEGFATAFCMATLGLGVGALLPGEARWRRAQLEVRPGQVRIEGAGPGVGRISARQVQALSTAAGSDRVVVAVGLGPFQRPVMVEVESAVEAEAVCDALAVGSRGLGKLVWPVGPPDSAGLRRVAAWVMTAASVLLPASIAVRAHGLSVLTGMALVGSVVLMLGASAAGSGAPRVALSGQGVDLSHTLCGWALVPYRCIEEVRRTAHGIEFKLEPPHQPIVLSLGDLGVLTEEELSHMIEQIRSASLRARGLGKRVRVSEEGLEDLRRGEESIGQWLERLETHASALRSGAAYRGEGYSAAALWQALEDHDADAELRVAAARVLVRVQPEEAAVRVAALADALRDEDEREAFELACDEHDLEKLARGLKRCGLWGDRDQG